MNRSILEILPCVLLLALAAACTGEPSPTEADVVDVHGESDADLRDLCDVSTSDGAGTDAIEAGRAPQTSLFPLAPEFFIGESVPVVDPARVSVLGRVTSGDGMRSGFLSFVDAMPPFAEMPPITLSVNRLTGLAMRDDRAMLAATVAGEAEVGGLPLPSLNPSDSAPEVLVASLDIETGDVAWACRVGPLPRGGGGAVHAAAFATSRYGISIGGSFSDYAWLDGGCPHAPLSTYINAGVGTSDGWAASYSPDGRFLRGVHVLSPADASIVGIASSDDANIFAMIGLIRDYAYILNVQNEEEINPGLLVPGPTHGQAAFVALAGPTGDPFWAAPVRGGDSNLVEAVYLDNEGVVVAGSRIDALMVQGTERLPTPPADEIYLVRFDPWGEFVGAASVMEATATVEQIGRWGESFFMVMRLFGEGRVVLPDGVRVLQSGADPQSLTQLVLRLDANGAVIDGRSVSSRAGTLGSTFANRTVTLGRSLFSVVESPEPGPSVFDMNGDVVGSGQESHTRYLMQWTR